MTDGTDGPDTRAPPTLTDLNYHDAVLAATRALLWINSPRDAKHAAVELVEALGGRAVAADEADSSALPVDVSFGDGDPLLPWAPQPSVARMLLARQLPGFIRDAHRAVELAARTQRLAEDAAVDPLTGLANRRTTGRALGRLRPDDVVVLLDLDDFKRLNDTFGHVEGDEVLRALGHTIAATVRARDVAGRYGGEEFIILLTEVSGPRAVEAFLARLRTSWKQARPYPVTFSAGVAPVGTDALRALQAADAAMYRAKRAGRDQWMWAGGSQSEEATDTSEKVSQADFVGFVGFSMLTVPNGGRDALEAAFADRLGLVDAWPGFQRLEVWADQSDASSYVMVSWWDAEASFRAYMASDEHRLSHDRIPGGTLRPRPHRFTRYKVIAR